MIKIYPNTKIYVCAPAFVATGGPELLHQLVYNLRKLNYNACMYYFRNDNYLNPIHPDYEIYNNPFVKDIEDAKDNILIVPELVDGIKILRKFHRIRKIVWWLSVDNFYTSSILASRKNFLIQRLINKLTKCMFGKNIIDIKELLLKNINYYDKKFTEETVKNVDFHLVQSFYAMNWLKNNQIPGDKIFYLSDYLNANFLNIKTELQVKEDIVIYNPKKGSNFTKKIIYFAKGIKFIPLINMSREEVIKTIQKAKVYIDFGNHPGKDRIPREAAILGCCVITNKRGSAAFYEDVPIPKDYKIADKDSNIPQIIEKIIYCFKNFDYAYKDFEYYRSVIKQEPQKFIECLNNIFKYE